MKQRIINTEKIFKGGRAAAIMALLLIPEFQAPLQGIGLRGTETTAEALDTVLLLTVVEKLKVHVAKPLVQDESQRIVAVVTVEGVTGTAGQPAVNRLPDPAAAVQKENAVIAKHTLATRYTHEKAVEHHAELHAEPAPVLDGDAVVSAPCPLLAGNTTLAGNNQTCHFVRGAFLYHGQCGIHFSYRQDIILCSLGTKPEDRFLFFTERPAHLGKVHPHIGTVTLERYHVAVNARELYQTVSVFHRLKNTKKEKPP